MPKRKPKPEKPVPVDPLAEVFQIGDSVEPQRPSLWFGYSGIVEEVAGGLCRVRVKSKFAPEPVSFHADIPAAELKKL